MSAPENAASPQACDASPPAGAEERRMVLLGRTGSGRSSSGNTILGRTAFRAEASPRSVTGRCSVQRGSVLGRGVSVVDTPGFLHTHLSHQEVAAEVGRCVALCPPGPHVFLVTLRPGRFTREERDALEWIPAAFGAGAAAFTMLLFTWGDQLRGKRPEDFLRESEELSRLAAAACRGRHHLFDNSGRGGPAQVARLLEKVDEMVAENAGGCYGDRMLLEAGRAAGEARDRILGERGAEAQPLQGEERRGPGEERRRREEEEARRKAERLFWCELATAMGRGAAEGAGITGRDEDAGKAVTKLKVVEKAAALATSPLSIGSAARAVGGAVREGGKVLYKHRKTLLH